MNKFDDGFKETLEQLALQVVMMDYEDIRELDDVFKLFAELETESSANGISDLSHMIHSLLSKVKSLSGKGKLNAEILENGVTVIQDMVRYIENDIDYSKEMAAFLEQFEDSQDDGADGEDEPGQRYDSEVETQSPVDISSISEPIPDQDATKLKTEGPQASGTPQKRSKPKTLTSEDVQILEEFAVEAMESLESIEINLIDLEQTPDDKEIINSIFRPFHTIKGVSGFLKLEKTNRLSHCTENLLDSVRNEEFEINPEIIDIILASVDVLKQLIHCVENSLTEPSPVLEGDIDVDTLIDQIEKAMTRFAEPGEKRLGDILMERGSVSEENLKKGLDIQKKQKEPRKIGEILIKEKVAKPKDIISAVRDQKQVRRSVDHKVKVDTLKLDNLVDQAGELVIAQAMLRQNPLVSKLNDQKLFQTLGQITQSVSSIQKIAMSMRMVSIGSTFKKMVRLVRDLTRSSGKKVNLEMFGEETEIDRNVVEELYDPLVHMIRNAVDHGIETPRERAAAGKAETGTIMLQAYHKGGNVVIEISDDGKGLDRQRIVQKAVSSGLIKADASLNDSQVYNLITQPGFSTAKQVTEVSGRGVGMDVVKQGIEKLRGHFEIQSELGSGTTFTITLPLTLAIIDGMIVKVANERYIIPTMTVIESFRPEKSQSFTVSGKGEMVRVRENLIPLIRLNRRFALSDTHANPWDALVVVVENKNLKAALLVDELIGKEEVVIKNLGETFKGIKGLAGGAILGDGRIGLILDVAGLMEN